MEDLKTRLYRSLNDHLNQTGLEWVVLHGYENLPQTWSNDLDLCADRRVVDSLSTWFTALDSQGIRPLLAFYSMVGEIAVVFMSGQGEEMEFAQVDITEDIVAHTMVRTIRNHEIMAATETFNGVPVPGPGVRFAYLLAKRVVKGEISEEQGERLLRSFTDAGEEAEPWARRLLGGAGHRACELLGRGDLDQFRSELQNWKPGLYARAISRSPRDFIRLRRDDWARLWNRFRDVSGISVAFIGSDGSGKSTALDACESVLAPGFMSTVRGHLRPGVLPDIKALLDPRKWGQRVERDVTDPHGKAPSGTLGSIARLAYYSLDYLFGHLTRVHLPAARNGMVLYDRYHLDWLVDPQRWRVDLPAWVRRAAVELAPQPQLWLLFDLSPQECYRRKPEVEIQELDRQHRAYRRFVLNREGGRIVDAAPGPSEVAQSARDIILDYQVQRARRRLSREPASQSLPVLCYRTVGPTSDLRETRHQNRTAGPKQPTARQLRADLTELQKRGYRLTSLRDHDPLGGRQVVLTFDGGSSNDWDMVLPTLQELGAVATFFVISGRLGQTGYLTRQQVVGLMNAGMEIGSNSHSHRPMTELSTPEKETELITSKAILEELTSAPIRHFAFPGGDYDPYLVERAYDAGFARACTTQWKHAQPGLGPFLVPRCLVGTSRNRIDAIDVVEQTLAYRSRALLSRGRDRLHKLIDRQGEE